MKSRVLYESNNKKESAKQIAEAIARGAKISCDPLEQHTTATELNVLFLGCEMSFGKIPGQMRKFIAGIDPAQVRQVAVFSIGPSPEKTGLKEIKAMLEPKGIKVSNSEFFCKMNVTDKELNDARAFGVTTMANLKAES